MRYPMMQSDLLVCVEIDKKMALQRGIVHCHHHPFLVRGHNTSAWTIVGTANHTPAC
jgi:hypothetical protein